MRRFPRIISALLATIMMVNLTSCGTGNLGKSDAGKEVESQVEILR